MTTPRTIRVFAASPSDLAVERRAFKDVLEGLNAGFGDALNITFEPLGWENTFASTGRRSQEVINKEIDRCDVFILAMHRRWGQSAPDTKPHSSYTEKAFHRAFDRWKKKPKGKKRQAPTIFAFFKHIDPGQVAEAGPQLRRVLGFREELAQSREVLHAGFANKTEFKTLVKVRLRAFAIGENFKEGQMLAGAVIEQPETFALELAERASKAALNGHLDEARKSFAQATDGTVNLRVLFLASLFYFRTGDLATAKELLERWLAVSGPDAKTADTASALGNLGLIYRTQGELGRAEELHLKALAINEQLPRPEGLANDYAALGLVYYRQERLEEAHMMHSSALFIEESLGRQDGIARQYGNLGLIHWDLGELESAETMFKKAMAIYESLRLEECIGIQCGHLGLVYREQGKTDSAEDMHIKALAISEKLGKKRGIAAQYGNLGFLAEVRGEMDRARELWTKARDLFAKIDMPNDADDIQEALDRSTKQRTKSKRVTGGGGKPKGKAEKKKGKKS